jgi:hypothetical protein
MWGFIWTRDFAIQNGSISITLAMENDARLIYIMAKIMIGSLVQKNFILKTR